MPDSRSRARCLGPALWGGRTQGPRLVPLNVPVPARQASRFRRAPHCSSTTPLTEYRQAIEDVEAHLGRLTQEIRKIVATWLMASVIAASREVRGAFMIAVTFAAKVGDVCRVDKLRQLMACPGQVPSENSTGEHVQCGSITKSGNRWGASYTDRRTADVSLARPRRSQFSAEVERPTEFRADADAGMSRIIDNAGTGTGPTREPGRAGHARLPGGTGDFIGPRVGKLVAPPLCDQSFIIFRMYSPNYRIVQRVAGPG